MSNKSGNRLQRAPIGTAVHGDTGACLDLYLVDGADGGVIAIPQSDQPNNGDILRQEAYDKNALVGYAIHSENKQKLGLYALTRGLVAIPQRKRSGPSIENVAKRAKDLLRDVYDRDVDVKFNQGKQSVEVSIENLGLGINASLITNELLDSRNSMGLSVEGLVPGQIVLSTLIKDNPTQGNRRFDNVEEAVSFLLSASSE